MVKDGNDVGSNQLQPSLVSEQIDKMFKFWSEVLKLPNIGPTYAFTRDIGSYANEIINLGKIMAELKTHMDEYWSLVNTAYVKALRETAERAPKQLVTKEDLEKYRRVMIEAFEEAFTELFASPEFSMVYGKLFSSQLDMSRSLQSMTERNFKALNLPTRSEIDEILRDVHELKRDVRQLKKSIEMIKNDPARSVTT